MVVDYERERKNESKVASTPIVRYNTGFLPGDREYLEFMHRQDLFIGLAALQRGRQELCTLVVILSVYLSVCLSVIMGIHFQAFKLKHRVLYSH